MTHAWLITGPPGSGRSIAAVWLSATAFLALLVLYFIGLDQGATSVFGNNTAVHEFVHDARHLLGFPCH